MLDRIALWPQARRCCVDLFHLDLKRVRVRILEGEHFNRRLAEKEEPLLAPHAALDDGAVLVPLLPAPSVRRFLAALLEGGDGGAAAAAAR